MMMSKACMVGDVDCVQRILDGGEDPNAVDRETGMTPLMHAANAKKENTSVVQLLVSHGANVNERRNDLMTTALMYATCRGHIETMNIMIRHGADVNAQNCKGCSALDIAVFRGDSAATECLVKAGANDARALASRAAMYGRLVVAAPVA